MKTAWPTDLPESEIDAQAASWARYVEFVDDGGYDAERLWSAPSTRAPFRGRDT